MKVLLYFEGMRYIEKSGIGRALQHQRKALESANIEYTLDPDEDYDILHINTIYVGSRNIINKARKKGAKVIYHAHSTMEDYKNSFLLSNSTANVFKRLLIYLYSKSDCIIAPTPYTKSLLENYGIKVPIYSVSNGIDINKFKHDSIKAEKFRNYFKLTDRDKVIVSSGLWIKRKGILDFVEVARLLPDITFIWFGDTPLYSIPAEIRNVVTKDHPPNVIFAGYMIGDVYEGAYSGADAFFFPSYEENEGIVVLEALASEQVAIVRDIPVYEPWLIDKVNCCKCKTNDEFISIIKEAVTGSLKPLTVSGRKTAEERSLYKIGQQLKEVYEKTIAADAAMSCEKAEKKLNIAMFTDTYKPDINGVSISVETLKESLERLGHNVYIVTSTLDTKLTGMINDGGILRIPGIKLKKLYGFRLSRPYSLKAKRLLKEAKIDVVHIHTEFSMRLFGMNIARAFNLPIVYTYHTMYEDYIYYVTRGYFDKTARKIVGLVSRLVGDTCTEIIAPTVKAKRTLEEYGIKKPINIIPTGIDLVRFSPDKVSRAEIEDVIDMYGLENKFRIIFLGRLAKEKNIDFLIRGMKLILKKEKDVVLIIAGYGPWEDYLKDYAEECGVSENVIFTGMQPHSRVPVFYGCANVFATASTTETQGLTCIEAMASGLPAIAKHDESIEGLIVDGVTGFIFNNEEEFAQCVLKIKNLNSEEYNKMSSNVLKMAQNYSIESFGGKMAEVYRKAVDSKVDSNKNFFYKQR